jgi:hypothetical protein
MNQMRRDFSDVTRKKKGSHVSSDGLAYRCNNEDIPMKLLVEVPITLQNELSIDIGMNTPYSTMARDALNDKYEGVQWISFLEGLQTS